MVDGGANDVPGLLLALLLLPAVPALADTLSGRVVAIADGDTLTVLTEGREQVRVRLSDIDTPERRQPWGTRARERLSELAFGQEVRVTVRDTDRYGRVVGRVWAGTTDLNAAMVRDGAGCGATGGGAYPTLGVACGAERPRAGMTA